MSFYKLHKMKMAYYINSNYGIHPKMIFHKWVNNNACHISNNKKLYVFYRL